MTRFYRNALLVMMAILLALTGCAAPVNASPSTATPAARPKPTRTFIPQVSPVPKTLPAAATPAPAPRTVYLLTVLSAQDRPDEIPQLLPREDGFTQSEPWEIAEAFHPSAGMRFLALQVAALNTDQVDWQFNPSALELTDESGATYPAQLGRAAQGLTAFNLHPGQWSSGCVVFELPESAVPLKVAYTLPRGQRLEVPLDLPPPLPASSPEVVKSARASNFGWSLRLISVEDPGEPFSTFAYTYIAGYRPVNLLLEVTNQTGEEAPLYPHRFTLMNEHGRLCWNNPGGASNSFDGGDLLPGETRQGEVSFDLPEGVRPSQLFFDVLPFTDQFLQISVQP